MDFLRDYLLRREQRVTEKMRACLGACQPDLAYLHTLWECQYWRECVKWLNEKIAHGCTDASCPLCDAPWVRFEHCEADCYAPKRGK